MSFPPDRTSRSWSVPLADIAIVIICIFVVLAFFKGWG